MVRKLSTEATDCYVQASAYARKAKLASTGEMRESFLRLEQSWLSLARSYELSDRLLVLSKENDCARNHRPLDGCQSSANKTELAEDASCADACALTPREQQVALLACTGLSNKEIGRALDLTEGSVKQYVCNVFRKLGINRRIRLRDFPRSRFAQQSNDSLTHPAEPTQGIDGVQGLAADSRPSSGSLICVTSGAVRR